MLIRGKNKKENDEHINLLDVDSFIINDKDKNRIDIDYTVSFIIYNFTSLQYNNNSENLSIKVHELLIVLFFYEINKIFYL